MSRGAVWRWIGSCALCCALGCTDLDALRGRANDTLDSGQKQSDGGPDSGNAGSGGSGGSSGSGESGSGGASGSGSAGTRAPNDDDGGIEPMPDAGPKPCAKPKTFYPDKDGDGFGDTKAGVSACDAPAGFITKGDDCNDDCKTCFPGGVESCEGVLDENCVDGVDEGCDCASGSMKDCGSDTGACMIGKQTCGNDGKLGLCTGDVGPVDELCDGVDNNCNDLIDEAFTNKDQPCTAGVGACKTNGTYVCLGNGSNTTCNAVAGQPAAVENCTNGIDDDCDNKTDEVQQDHGNCGACGYACAGTLACVSSKCTQPVTALRVGSNLSCALLGAADANASYPLSCWGDNGENQLMANTSPDTFRATPGTIPGGRVRDVASGTGFICTLDDGSDTISCWGSNDQGQLGVASSSATSNSFVHTGTAALSAGYNQGCLLTNSGEVHCWGTDFSGARGNDTAYPTRQMVFSPAAAASEISVSYPLACARMTNGTMQCWGVTYSFTSGSSWTPHVVAPDAGATFLHVAASGAGGAPAAHACAVQSNGKVRCWGYNLGGELGIGTVDAPASFTFHGPATIGVVSNAIQVSVGLSHSCALTSAGTVYCWGQSQPALGNGSDSSATTPTPTAVAGLTDVIEISSGEQHNCARRRSGQVVCWGNNFAGQLGDGTSVARTAPRNVSGLP